MGRVWSIRTIDRCGSRAADRSRARVIQVCESHEAVPGHNRWVDTGIQMADNHEHFPFDGEANV